MKVRQNLTAKVTFVVCLNVRKVGGTVVVFQLKSDLSSYLLEAKFWWILKGVAGAMYFALSVDSSLRERC